MSYILLLFHLPALSQCQRVYLFVWQFVCDMPWVSGVFVWKTVLCGNIFPQTAQR